MAQKIESSNSHSLYQTTASATEPKGVGIQSSAKLANPFHKQKAQDTIDTPEIGQLHEEKTDKSWITVVGVVPEKAEDVISRFTQFGDIEEAEDSPGNWIYIKYSAEANADSAIKASYDCPILISNYYAVSCTKGRIKNQFIKSQIPPPKRIEYNPDLHDVVIPQERKDFVGQIMDSLLGC